MSDHRHDLHRFAVRVRLYGVVTICLAIVLALVMEGGERVIGIIPGWLGLLMILSVRGIRRPS